MLPFLEEMPLDGILPFCQHRFMTKASLVAATVISLLSASAHADVIPMDVYACNKLSAGSPCENGAGGAGVCQDSTCSRLDYAHWDRDASASPPSTSYSCLKCVPKGTGTGTGSATVTKATTDTNTETTTKATTGTGVATGTGEGTGTGAVTNTTTASGTDTGPGDKEKDTDSSGCSIGGARVIAPWLLAGIFAACVSLLRRRRR